MNKLATSNISKYKMKSEHRTHKTVQLSLPGELDL